MEKDFLRANIVLIIEITQISDVFPETELLKIKSDDQLGENVC